LARQRAGNARGGRARPWPYAGDGSSDQGATGIWQEAGRSLRYRDQPHRDDLSGVAYRAGTRPADWRAAALDRRCRRPRSVERFQAKWIPVRIKKTRQIKNLEPRFDSIETERLQDEVRIWRATT